MPSRRQIGFGLLAPAHYSIVLVPPLALIFAVLGSILMGIATVNQAGAIGATGAMIMAGYRLKQGNARRLLSPPFIAHQHQSWRRSVFLLSNFTTSMSRQ